MPKTSSTNKTKSKEFKVISEHGRLRSTQPFVLESNVSAGNDEGITPDIQDGEHPQLNTTLRSEGGIKMGGLTVAGNLGD